MTALRSLVLAPALLVLGLAAGPVLSDDDGFTPLFNGKDLSGWVNVNSMPSTWRVEEGQIVTTGLPMGYLRTTRMYENFIAEFEWMHKPPKPDAPGNSGFFVWCDPLPAPGTAIFSRGIEVQVLVNLEKKDFYTSHGDIFSIWGADCTPDRPHPQGWKRCLPSENRCKGANEWNHYRVEAKDGKVSLAVNGKVVSSVSKCTPRKGYLALEAEGSECRFRNLKIKELPSSNPKPEEIADEAHDWQRLFNGADLTGWKDNTGHRGHWVPKDGILSYDGKSESKEKDLWTEKEFGDFVLVADWRLTAKPTMTKRPVILPTGEVDMADGKPKEMEVADAGASGISLRGSNKAQVSIWCWPVGSGALNGYRTDKDQPAEVKAVVTPRLNADRKPGQWNRFIITMKGDRITVDLNGKRVIDGARLPGVAKRGPIGLMDQGDRVEFSNLYIRDLK